MVSTPLPLVTGYNNGRILTALTFNWTINKDIVSQTLTGPPEMTPMIQDWFDNDYTTVIQARQAPSGESVLLCRGTDLIEKQRLTAASLDCITSQSVLNYL